jgi:RHS repeat-associated protein
METSALTLYFCRKHRLTFSIISKGVVFFLILLGFLSPAHVASFENTKEGDWYGLGDWPHYPAYIWGLPPHGFPTCNDSVTVTTYFIDPYGNPYTGSVSISADACCGTLHRHWHGDIDTGWLGGYGSHALTVTTLVDWTGGRIAAQPLINQGTMVLSSFDPKVLGGTLRNQNRVDHMGTVDLGVAWGGRIQNEAGAIYEFQGDGTISIDGGGGAWPQFDNKAGATLLKSGGSDTATIGVVFSCQGGTIDVRRGTLHLKTGGGTSTGGTFLVSDGAILDLTISEGDPNTFVGTYTGSGSGEVRLRGGTLQIGSGGATFNFPGSLFQWSGGSIVGNSLTNNGTMNLSTLSTKEISALQNNGLLIQSDDGNVGLRWGGFLSNNPGGLYDIRGDGDVVCGGGGGAWPQFYNKAGAVLRKSQGEGTSSFDCGMLNNEGGTVEVQSGVLRFAAGGGTSTGGVFNVSHGAILDLSPSSGQHKLKGDYTGSGGGEIRFSGNRLEILTGGATFNFPGSFFQWTGGEILAQSGSLTNLGTMNLSGSNLKWMGGTINNANRMTFAGTGNFEISWGGNYLNNQSGALFDIQGYGNVVGRGVFNNYGTLRKSGGGDVTTLDVAFKNYPDAVVEVLAGTLRLGGGGAEGTSTGGIFHVEAGAVLDLMGGSNQNYTGTYTGSGEGTVLIGNGQLRVGAGGATFNFPGSLFQWTGGQILAQSGSLTNLGTMNLSGSNLKWMAGTMNNAGVVTHTGAGNFQIQWGGNYFNNQSGALYDLQSDGGLEGTGWFNNAGTLRKSAGIGSSGFNAKLNNTGTVEVLSGTLNFTESVSQISGAALTGGTWKVGTDSTLNITTGSQITTNQATIVLDGPNSNFSKINTLATNKGSFTILRGRNFTTVGSLSNTGTITVGPLSTLAVNGDYNQASELTIQIGDSPESGKFGRMNITGTANLDGVLNIVLVDGFGPRAGQSFEIMTFGSRNGQFSTVNGLVVGKMKLFDIVYTDNAIILTSLKNAADLAVSSITIPSSGVPGQNVTISYRVENRSTGTAYGPWTDSIYLSSDNRYQMTDKLIGRVTHVGDLEGLGSYTETLTAPLPAVIEGSYYIIVVNDSQQKIPDLNRSDNTSASAGVITTTIPLLTMGVTTNGTIDSGQNLYYRLDISGGRNVRITANFTPASGASFYLRYGKIPDQGSFDWVAPMPKTPSSSQEIILPNPQPGRYYVLLHGLEGVSGGKPFDITPQETFLELSSVSPGRGANVGSVTVTIKGSGFTPSTTASLIASGGSQRAASVVLFKDPSTLYATFDLSGLETGLYDVKVQEKGQTATAEDVFVVTTGVPGRVVFGLSVPPAIRAGQTVSIAVTYENAGDTDAIAPLMWLTADFVNMRDRRTCQCLDCPNCGIHPVNQPVFKSAHLLGINREGPAGILPPAAGGTIFIDGVPTIPSGMIHYALYAITNTEAPIDWSVMKTKLRPNGIPAEAWEPIFANFVDSVGNTLGTLQARLAANATHLSLLGEYSHDVNRLITFEFLKAGLSEIGARYHLGAFGRGGSHPWDIWGQIREQGRAIHYPNGEVREFFKAAGSPVGGQFLYTGGPGDDATLSNPEADPDHWTLVEPDGTKFQFTRDPLLLDRFRLDFVEYLNGNRLSLSYTDGRVTTVVYSNGDTLRFHYNMQGRIDQITDPVGRVTVLSYDTAGEHLTSVTDHQGTLAFSYVTGQGAAREHAIESIQYPDGTAAFFEYDARGRLVRATRTGTGETFQIAYDSSGSVAVTSTGGGNTTAYSNEFGQLAQFTYPNGSLLRLGYDENHRLISLGSSAGIHYRFEYDDRGNLIKYRDPLGRETSMSYTLYNRMTEFLNALGNATRFGYDGHYNLKTITYPDGSTEGFSYDSWGNPTQWVNRRGHTVSFSYDLFHMPTRKDYADGSYIEYTYDDYRNLITATDSKGTTHYTYDSADRITRVTYPDGRFLEFEYDGAGRRIRMADHDGWSIRYLYDSAGRLTGLTNESGDPLVSYQYDTLGRLARKDLKNGTYSIYTYDALSQLTSLVNYGADGAILSRFDYTHDALGRATSMSTLEGLWTYQYDLAGQLTEVGFPDGKVLRLTYDAMGNRTSVTENGISTEYVTNGLDQYTSLGNMTYTYDADGHLISKTDGTKTWTYTYDDEGRLISAVTPDGTWDYEYDTRGNRVVRNRDGVQRQYLIDPVGMGDVIGEYDGSGFLVARNVHGLGLVHRDVPGGFQAYYAYDRLGNAVTLTDEVGTVLNEYAYSPFGGMIKKQETVPNPFTFQGAFGTTEEGDGQLYMRNRHYDPSLGRFTSPDPLGLTLGDDNLYCYMVNDPVNGIDPLGLQGTPVYPFIWQEQVFLYRNCPLAAQGVDKASKYHNLLRSYGGEAFRIHLQVGRGTLIHFAKNLFRPKGSPWHIAVNQTHIYPDSVVYPKVPNPRGFADYREIWYFGEPLGQSAKTWFLKGGAKAIGKRVLGLLSWGWTCYDVGRFVSSHTGLDDGMTNLFYYLWFYKVKEDEPLWGPAAAELFKIMYGDTRVVAAADPNVKITVGYGDEGFITGDSPLVYTIHFENQPDATAPAQRVVVTDQLSGELDWTTVELLSIGFNNVDLILPEGLTHFEGMSAVDTDPNPVHVRADFNPDTGLLTWLIESLDPETGDLPGDPLAGFLPPNKDCGGCGEGYVSFVVWPKRGLVSGTAIKNKATIVFDVNAPIDTAEVMNTIDDIAPTSSVLALPPVTNTETFRVSWAGSDNSGGSGVAFFDIYVSIDGGPFTLWLSETEKTSEVFSGAYGHTYGFYSVATDHVWNEEEAPSGAQALTRVPAIWAKGVLLKEGFTEGIPEDWLVGGEWTKGDTTTPCGGKTIGSPFGAPWAIVDSSCADTPNEVLFSPSFDASMCTSVTLEFSNRFAFATGSRGDVAVSKDGGETWDEVFTLPEEDVAAETREVDISSVVPSTQGQLAFVYSASSGYWALDNVGVLCDPAALSFLSAVGVESSPQSVTVGNRGEEELNITDVGITGVDASMFGLLHDGCKGRALSIGDRCNIEITFTPTSEGEKKAMLSITSDDPTTPVLEVSLTGNPVASLVIPTEGTLGTELMLKGKEFGAKKGKVLIGGMAVKVVSWTGEAIGCEVNKVPLPPAVQDIVIQRKEPKGAPAITIPDGFEVKGPEIVWLDKIHGKAGDSVTLVGKFFGTKKGKVFLGTKSCKVVTWTMNPVTGHSEVVFVVPKGLTPGAQDLTISNKVGSTTMPGAFRIE